MSLYEDVLQAEPQLLWLWAVTELENAPKAKDDPRREEAQQEVEGDPQPKGLLGEIALEEAARSTRLHPA